MPGQDLSRREFVLATTAVLSAATARAQSRDLTAQDVVDRIRASAGVPWREKTVDGFKAGDPATVVTGIATTVMATMDVLRRAAAARRNLIVTQRADLLQRQRRARQRARPIPSTSRRRPSSTSAAGRLALLAITGTRACRTIRVQALAEALGWASRRHAAQSHLHDARDDARRADRARSQPAGRSRRAADRSATRRCGCASVLLSPGTTDLPSTMRDLRNADLVIAGEPREWEVVPYVARHRDRPGSPRRMIALGRVVSEEPGMRACAAWMRTLAAGSAGRGASRSPIRTGAQSHDRRSRSSRASRSSSRSRASPGATETVDTFKAGHAGDARCAASPRPAWRRSTCCGAPRRPAGTSSSRTSRRSTTTRIRPTALAEGRDLPGEAAVHREHHLVVWRFHDHAHALRPDPLVAGSARALGWTAYASPAEPRIYMSCRRRRCGRWRRTSRAG